MKVKEWVRQRIFKGESPTRMFFNIVYFFETGKGRTVSRIYSPISEFLVLLIFLQQRDIEFSFLQIASVIFVTVLVIIFIGRWYISKDLFKLERSIDNEQNKELMEIKRSTEEIKLSIEEIKQTLKNGKRGF